jgi:hypothetical protein
MYGWFSYSLCYFIIFNGNFLPSLYFSTLKLIIVWCMKTFEIYIFEFKQVFQICLICLICRFVVTVLYYFQFFFMINVMQKFPSFLCVAPLPFSVEILGRVIRRFCWKWLYYAFFFLPGSWQNWSMNFRLSGLGIHLCMVWDR